MKAEKKIKIYNQLKLELFSGENQIKKIPGEIALARRFGVCRETVRGALSMLRGENIIHSSQGKHSEVNYLPINIQSILAINLYGDDLTKVAEEVHLKVISLSKKWLYSLTRESFNAMLERHRVGCIVIYVSGLFGTENYCEIINSSSVPVYITCARKKDFTYFHCSGSYTSLPRWWQMALQYLNGKGHHRIASFVPRQAGFFHGIPIEEYYEMLTACGLDNRDCYIFRAYPFRNFQQEHNPTEYYGEIREELKRMMELPNPPTAVLCYSNQWAELVYKAAAELNITIPDRLSVMGFVSMDVTLTPELTTAKIDTTGPMNEFIRLVKNVPPGSKIKRSVTEVPMRIVERCSVKDFNAKL